MSSKFVGSKLGKQSVESIVMTDQVRELIRALRKIIEAESDKETAEFTEKAIIKLVLKCYLQWSEKSITTQDLLKIDAPLREAFNLIDNLYRKKSTVKAAALKETFVRIERCFAEVEKLLSALLRQYIRADNMLMLHKVAEHVGSAGFLMRVWDLNREDPTGEFDKNMFALVNAMTSYTQIELSP
eukprot:TRINITY_DN960_c0_g1_i1.p1 TRINITY_DN960_c0_g1~~TRINITY_DN960_c0_g1_i1.p1  ORF type:complete len:185 (+),score=62.02 TRINITY_DN960_c0_g1_i1:325-879(+)